MSDILRIILADLHTGSQQALMTKHWKTKRNNHPVIPNSKQVKIREWWDVIKGRMAKRRKGYQVELILLGDLLEGYHHDNGSDLIMVDPMDMAEMSISLIIEFQKAIGWQRGDRVHVIKGTEVHTGDLENMIGEEIGAEQNRDGNYSNDTMQLQTNGTVTQIAHHGGRVGFGANEGNTLINNMKNVVVDCNREKILPPDMICYAHVHTPMYSTYTWRGDDFYFRTMHTIVAPSMKAKDRYTHKASPIAVNRIGAVSQVITSGGIIGVPIFDVMRT